MEPLRTTETSACSSSVLLLLRAVPSDVMLVQHCSLSSWLQSEWRGTTDPPKPSVPQPRRSTCAKIIATVHSLRSIEVAPTFTRTTRSYGGLQRRHRTSGTSG